VGPFSLSPSSGPAGTVVNVSGGGCLPGVVVSASQDFVEVDSTMAPPAALHLAVGADGSWHGAFAIPGNAPAGPVAVTALCFSSGLPSLNATYIPQIFMVTGPAPPTTTTRGAASTPPSTASSSVASPPSTTGPSNGGRVAGGPTGRQSGVSSSPGGSSANPATGSPSGARAGAAPRAASLSTPALNVAHQNGIDVLSWLWWFLVLTVAVAVISSYAWLRWERRRNPRLEGTTQKP
jgi:hypothetical protein